MIGGRRLAGKKESTRGKFESRVESQPVVQNHDVQNIKELALVLVDTFDLAVKNGVWVNRMTGGRCQPIGETTLYLPPDLEKALAETGVERQGFQRSELGCIGD